MTVYIDLADFCEIAADILGSTPEQIARLPRIALADSALSAPSSGVGEVDACPRLSEKGAALIEHLARDHPLPDGNKRAAFLSVWLFMEADGRPFRAEDPETDVAIVERIAAGEATREEVVAWIDARTAPPPR